MNAVTTPEVPLVPVNDFAAYVPLATRTKSPGIMRPTLTPLGEPVLGDDGKPKTHCIAAGPVIDFCHFVIGMKSESGETVGDVKSALFYGKEFNVANFYGELGDLWWYTAVGVSAFNSVMDKLGFPLYTVNVDEYVGQAQGFARKLVTGAGDQRLFSGLTLVDEWATKLMHVVCEIRVELPIWHHTEWALEREDAARLSIQVQQTVAALVGLSAAFYDMERQHVVPGLQDTWARNIRKLRIRYPDAFSTVLAIERGTQAQELAALGEGTASVEP